MYLPLKITSPKPQKKPASYLLTVIVTGCALLMLSVSLWLLSQDRAVVLGAESSLNASEIISLINLQRTEYGLEGLKPNPLLEEAARAKLLDMNTNNYFAHKSDTKDPWDFIAGAGYVYLHAGENLAREFYHDEDLVEAWMNSPAHRDNILSPNYTETGVAIDTESDPPVIVQFFATPLTPAPTTATKINPIQISGYLEKISRHKYLLATILCACIFLVVAVSQINAPKKTSTNHPTKNLWKK